MTAATGPDAERAAGFRPDIEGLRAVAVLAIVLYHARVSALSGGFVGVDVFFVISGFLITGLLARELETTGRLNLLEFYARRVRRILPAAFLVLGVTLVLSVVLLSPIGFARIATGIAASAAYVPNVLFAFQRNDYFHPAYVSPVIHYWSLGVEEQFYLLWPAFLWLVHRAVGGSRRRLIWAVAAVVAGSFVLSLIATAVYPAWAFYLLPTRAWELGVGGLIALAGPALAAAGRRARIATWAVLGGLALIAAASVLFRDSTPFPGVAAVVPVLGAALVIGGGESAGGLATTALASPPMRYVGRISYSVYLWHWPLLVFAPTVLAWAAPALQVGIALAATFGLAAATYRAVEDPLRRGALLGRRPSRNLAVAAVTSVVLVAGTFGTRSLVTARFRQAHAVDVVPVGVDPFVGLLPLAGPVPDGPLPADLIPPVLNLHRGHVVNDRTGGGCSLETGETVNGRCTFGSTSPAQKVILFGDSHLAQWWPALERIMADRDWQVELLIKTSCTYADVTVMGSSGPKTECDAWRAGALDRIARERPDLVLVAANHRFPPIQGGVALAGAAADAAMAAGAERTIDTLERLGARVVVLADTPELPYDPADCLTANPDHVAACAVPRDQAVGLAWHAAEQAAAGRAGATYIDVDDWACAADPCPLVIGRYAVFADTNHLTRPFVQGLTLRLEAAIPP